MIVGIVGVEVFEGRDRAGVEHAGHVALDHACGQERILAEVFKVPPTLGLAVDVHARPQQHGHAGGPALFAHALGVTVGEGAVFQVDASAMPAGNETDFSSWLLRLRRMFTPCVASARYSSGMPSWGNPLMKKVLLPVMQLENAFATPHIGANTMEGQEAVSIIIAEQVLHNALHDRPYLNAVNIPFLKSQLPEHLRLYFDLTEKMGKLAAQIAQGRPEKITIVMVERFLKKTFANENLTYPSAISPSLSGA